MSHFSSGDKSYVHFIAPWDSSSSSSSSSSSRSYDATKLAQYMEKNCVKIDTDILIAKLEREGTSSRVSCVVYHVSSTASPCTHIHILIPVYHHHHYHNNLYHRQPPLFLTPATTTTTLECTGESETAQLGQVRARYTAVRQTPTAAVVGSPENSELARLAKDLKTLMVCSYVWLYCCSMEVVL